MTFEELCAVVADRPGFSRRRAFGRDGLMLDGKAVLCSDPAGVVFRVGPEAEASALAVAGAQAWSPMGAGRAGPRGWVLVPAASASEWPRLAGVATGFVATLAK